MSAKERKALLEQATHLRVESSIRHNKRQSEKVRKVKGRSDIDEWMWHVLANQERAAEQGEPGRVAEVHAGGCVVLAAGESIPCKVTGELGRTLQSSLAPGDHVRWFREPGPRVVSVVERRSCLTRPDPAGNGRRLAVAANVDLALVVLAQRTPALHPRVVDRYLVAAQQGGIGLAIALNKADLPEPGPEAMAFLQAMEAHGTPLVRCSAESGVGLSRLRELIAGKTVVLVGPSGVGKTSLTNRLCGVEAEVSHVSDATGKGRHTTRASTLRPTLDGGWLIDTPGVRSFGLDVKTAEELREWFPDFADLAANCKFRDCLHASEPGCAVRVAAREDPTVRHRYRSYLRLMGDYREVTPLEDVFQCRNCDATVPLDGACSEHRNHCPHCLHSLHVDDRPGDRASGCGGVMEPVALWVRHDGEWALVHRCTDCGTLKSNRIAGDDNPALLLSLAVRPLSRPPFPLERLAAMR